MLSLFIAAMVLRFLMSPVNFGIARIFFTLTIMAFYFRLLRFGYILQNIGPRIITIAALVSVYMCVGYILQNIGPWIITIAALVSVCMCVGYILQNIGSWIITIATLVSVCVCVLATFYRISVPGPSPLLP